MDNIPLVSVIITFYNSGDFVHSAIKEVQKQTYKKIEIICINDGSQDETLSFLKKYQQEDNRIIIINKKNEGGAHNALAAGQKVVKGKYVITFDHDDKLGEDALEKAVVSMEQNPDWGISLFKVKIMDENGNLLESRPQPKNILTALEAVKATIIRFHYAFRCLYKREVFQSYSYYYQEPWLNYDEYVGRQLIYNAKFIGFNSGVYYYVQNQKSCTSRISLKTITPLETEILNREFIKKIGLYVDIEYDFEIFFMNKLNSYIKLYEHELKNKSSQVQKKYAQDLFKRAFDSINKNIIFYSQKGIKKIYMQLLFSNFFIYYLIRKLR